MKFEKHADYYEKCDLDCQSETPDESEYFKVPGSINHAYNFLSQTDRFANDTKNEGQNDVEEEEHEELSVCKSHTVRDPGTVMVHIEHATLTGRAVVTPEYLKTLPFRFKTMAEEAVPSFTVISFFCKEAPVDGDPSRVSDDGLGHTPEEHDEEEVEDDEDGDVPGGTEVDHEAVHEDEVVG